VDIDFGRAGNGVAYLKAGWSDPEATETWAVGGTSFMAIPAPDERASYFMMFKLRPHIVAGRLTAQRLHVAVNGVDVGRFTLTKPSTRACRIPWSAINDRKVMDIRLDMPDAARPSELGSATDQRALGIAFASLKIFADLGAAVQDDGAATNAEPAAIDIETIAAADRIAVGELMLKFESLGQNCEFGLVQRKCGAEPLSLLRFSSTPLPKLLAALEAEFEGMGSPETVHVQVSANGRELMINDSRFGFLYHAFVQSGAMSPEALHRREVRRVPLLIRKLLEDLQSADKIFVFKGMGAVPEEEIFPLAALLRHYGPNTLLFVTLADGEHPAGSVEFRAPGFLVGYMSRFAPTEDAADFDVAQWVRVCREAYRLRLAADWLQPTLT
jgi:hypothetical protein